MSNIIWAEKYRPHKFSDLQYNTEIESRLMKLISTEDFPHLLLYGPSGAGKRSLTKCILNEIYGEGVHKMKSEIKEFKATQSTTVDCVVYQSNYHLEVAPAESDRYDRVIINTLIKELAGSAHLDVIDNVKHNWKIIVIHELDKLSRDAQSGLRRTMEKYMHNCRIIFNCESLSRVMSPLKSRCVQIRVPGPKVEEIQTVLQSIANAESFELNDGLAEKIALSSKRNMRRAIMILQTLKSYNSSLTSKLNIPKPGYEEIINEICDMINTEQTPKQLKAIRSKFYELLTKGVDSTLILNNMTKRFLETLDDFVKPEIVKYAVESDYRCRLGQKDIVHLEAFAATAMMVLRNHMS